MRNYFPIIAIVLLVTTSGTVEAHHRRSDPRVPGIEFASLTHGQLAIVADYYSAILMLADRQISPSLEARTLRNFAGLQHAYCLWGLVPGSLTREDSPFNECSHAYLSASKALLDVLAQTAETREQAQELLQRINLALALDASALQMCRNSLGTFGTGEIVLPEWRSVAINPLGILFGVVVVGVPGGLLAAARAGRTANAAVR